MEYDSSSDSAHIINFRNEGIHYENIAHENIKPIQPGSGFCVDRHPVQFSGGIVELQKWYGRS